MAVFKKCACVHRFVVDSEHIPSLQWLPESPEDFNLEDLLWGFSGLLGAASSKGVFEAGIISAARCRSDLRHFRLGRLDTPCPRLHRLARVSACFLLYPLPNSLISLPSSYPLTNSSISLPSSHSPTNSIITLNFIVLASGKNAHDSQRGPTLLMNFTTS